VRWIDRLSSRRKTWLGAALLIAIPLGYVAYLWIDAELSRRNAPSALHQVLPTTGNIVRETTYSCNSDDGGLPMCGTDYVVLPGQAGPQWAEAIRNKLVGNGYDLLLDNYTGGQRWDIDAVRGKDEIYAIIPDAAGRKMCFENIASQAKRWHIDPRTDAWECAASLRYSRLFRPKTHL
jgi:hypothetical protein